MKHRTFFLFASTVSLTAYTLCGATVYKDIAAGDVTSLTNELAQSRDGNTVVIRLAAGDYDLTGIEMDSGSHLYLENRAIVGQGDSPWKTRLIGDGTKRILNAKNGGYGNYTYCRIENLTVTNGWTSGDGGGVAGYPHVINCVVIGNHAEGNGGGLGGYAYCNRSLLMNNTAKGNGGGSYCPNFIYNTEICGNTAQTGGGVCGNGGSFYGSITNCDIHGNIALTYGGGVRTVTRIETCRIFENESGLYGGGIMGHVTTLGGGYIADSTICSNKCVSANDANYGYGGGGCCYVMTNCTVSANYGRHGGGVSQCDAYKCDFHDNYGAGYGGGAHGGMVGGRAEKCTFGANISGISGGGHNAYGMGLVDCDVSYTGVYAGLATRCTFHDIGRKAVIDNPYVVAAVTNSDVYAGIPICTNCLFVDNRQEWYYDRSCSQSYGQSIFKGVDSAKRKAQIVNCTIVSNTVGQTFLYCRTPAQPWNVENSVFFGNRCYWGNGDLVNYDQNITNGIFLTRCAYGICGSLMSDPSVWTKAGDVNYKFGADGFPSKPVFLYERKPGSELPFSIWYTSPLRGAGKVEDWMASATDIRGDADGGRYLRLRDGRCDIGCYQCWEKIPGIVFSFR